MKNIAIILAGGKGSRFGRKLPKQFAKIAGKTILEHSLDAFQKCKSINEIVIVVHPDFTEKTANILLKNQYEKLTKILLGGKERIHSSLAAIKAFQNEKNDDEINLIFHDAVRPFVSQSILEMLISSLNSSKAVGVAIKATDTIVEVCKHNKLLGIPNRNQLRKMQTPQAFRLQTIKKAYEKAQLDPDFEATDDCGVVFKYLPQEEIKIVEGSVENIKITYELDMFVAEKIWQQKSSAKI